jgi:hypothetical protein
MIGTAFKVNIDAIGNREHSSTRLIWAIDAIGNREHSSIGMLYTILPNHRLNKTQTEIWN